MLHRSSSCMHAVATTPAEPQGAFLAHFPRDGSLPRNYGGSASALRFSRPARRSLALRPAYSPSHMMTLYTGGFSRFVASTAAPIATGWSESCRAGFAPAGKPCLRTAHIIKHGKEPDDRHIGPFLGSNYSRRLWAGVCLSGMALATFRRLLNLRDRDAGWEMSPYPAVEGKFH